MDEVMDIMMELAEALNDFPAGTVEETKPGKGKQPPQTRSIDIGQVCAYFAMVEAATKGGRAADAALMALGRRLLYNARWHDVAEGEGG